MGSTPSARDYAGIPRVRRPRASPSGEYVAFFWNPGDQYELFVYNIETERYRQLTDGDLHRSPNAPAIWGPTGETLYFQTGDHGYDLGEIHRIDLGGTSECIANPGGDWGMLWGVDPTERWLLYTHTVEGTQRVFRHDIADEERVQLSSSDTVVPSRGTRIAPDGNQVCYPGTDSSEPDIQHVYLVDLSGGTPQRIPVSKTKNVRPQAWHLDSKHLLLYDEENHRTGEFDLDSEEIQWFGPARPLAYLSTETILTSDPSLYDRSTGNHTEVSINGRVGDELIGNAVCIDSDRVIFTRSSERRPTELYLFNVHTGDERRLVTTDLSQLDPENFVTAEEITYESTDGRLVSGLLYRPIHASKDNQVPVIVEAHGLSQPGMRSKAVRRFERKIQYFVSQGYAILQPNYRGTEDDDSTFAELIAGDWGGDEQEDIAAAVPWLTSLEWVDSEKIALYGHSFGGFTVYTQMVRYPERWEVGVASGGITDLHLLDASKDGDELLRELMGHPKNNAELWRDRSPITHIENIQAPLLILHGIADPTTPISQARAFKGALEAVRGWTKGDEFEYEEIDTGSHGNIDGATNAKQWKLIIEFLNRRL